MSQDGLTPDEVAAIAALLASDRAATLGQAIVTARNIVDFAENEFRAVVRDALDKGASARQVADLLGWNTSTVQRWARNGKSRRLESRNVTPLRVRTATFWRNRAMPPPRRPAEAVEARVGAELTALTEAYLRSQARCEELATALVERGREMADLRTRRQDVEGATWNQIQEIRTHVRGLLTNLEDAWWLRAAGHYNALRRLVREDRYERENDD